MYLNKPLKRLRRYGFHVSHFSFLFWAQSAIYPHKLHIRDIKWHLTSFIANCKDFMYNGILHFLFPTVQSRDDIDEMNTTRSKHSGAARSRMKCLVNTPSGFPDQPSIRDLRDLGNANPADHDGSTGLCIPWLRQPYAFMLIHSRGELAGTARTYLRNVHAASANVGELS